MKTNFSESDPPLSDIEMRLLELTRQLQRSEDRLAKEQEARVRAEEEMHREAEARAITRQLQRSEDRLAKEQEARVRAEEEMHRAEEEMHRAEEARVRAEEEMHRAEEARVRAEEEMHRAEEARVRAEEKAAEDEKAFGFMNILVRGLPELEFQNLGSSSASRSSNKSQSFEVEMLEGNLKILDDFCIDSLKKRVPNLKLNCSLIMLKAFKNNGKLHWASEHMIQEYVNMVINDIIELSGEQLRTFSEVYIYARERKLLRANILVIRYNDSAIGVIEVKKPHPYLEGQSLECTDTWKYQLCQYMLELQCTHGVQCVFGIVTNYKEWRICWLEPANKIAVASEETSEISTTCLDNENLVRMYATKIFDYNDARLVEALVTTVKKMTMSLSELPTISVSSLSLQQRKFLVAHTRGNFKYIHLSGNLTSLTWLLPETQPAEFYLLQKYGAGSDGIVWLALTCSCSGTKAHICIIKIFNEIKDCESICSAEAELWTNLWDQVAYSLQLFDCWSLVLPFAFHAIRMAGTTISFRPLGILSERVESGSGAKECMNSASWVCWDEDSVTQWFENPEGAAKNNCNERLAT